MTYDENTQSLLMKLARKDERRKIRELLKARLGKDFPDGWECAHGINLTNRCSECLAGAVKL
jgi:hypothetical protein